MSITYLAHNNENDSVRKQGEENAGLGYVKFQTQEQKQTRLQESANGEHANPINVNSNVNNNTNDHIPMAQEINLHNVSETYWARLSYADALLFHLFLGFFGALHFRMGRICLGLLYLFTIGGFGLGWFVDWFRLMPLVKEYNAARGRLEGIESTQTLILDSYAIWIVGIFGANHFYLHRYKWGFLYLFTCGLFLVGWIMDLFRIPLMVESYQNQLLKRTSQYSLLEGYILLASPFGFFGIHHLYLGNYLTFAAYLCTIGFFGVGWFIDFFRMPALVNDANERLLLSSTKRNLGRDIPNANIIN